MNERWSPKQDEYRFGAEVSFDNLSGRSSIGDRSHRIRVIDNLDDMTLADKYMSVKLLRLFLNIQLQSIFTGSKQSVTILRILFHNIWDHRLHTYSNSCTKMIDSEGFQHSGDGGNYIEFSRVILPGGRTVEAQFPPPEYILEDHAKTKGWVWFDNLPKGVLPHRFLFQIQVFEPGEIDGWVKDSETLEFIISSYQINEIRQLPT